jgi:ATP-dependent DNA helicase RecG
VFTESNSAKTASRLKALKTAKNGFELAEYDLEFRGAGDLAGKKQWGVTDVGMEALKNIKMVEAARKEAQDIIEKSPELKNFPLLRQKILERGYDIHFE